MKRSAGSDTALLMATVLFDHAWYSTECGEALSRRAAVTHYLSKGAGAGFDPNPHFDSDWYLTANPDVAAAGFNPLVHFLTDGAREGRNPSAEFDLRWYIERYPDVALAGIAPFTHYVEFGFKEGRLPNRYASADATARHLLDIKNRITPLTREFAELRHVRLVSESEIASELKWVREDLGLASAFSAHPGIADAASEQSAASFPPSPVLTSMRNVVALGGTRIVFVDNDRMIFDEAVRFGDDPTVHLKRAGDARVTRNDYVVHCRRGAGNILDRGLHGMHEYSNNYFHLLVEVLPRILASRKSGLCDDFPLLINGGLHRNFRSMIDIVDDNRPRIELTPDKLYTVENLLYASDVSSVQDVYSRERHPWETVLHVELIREVVARILSVLGHDGVERKRKLYVRRGRRYRGLLNEGVTEDALVARGFEILSVDELSLSSQIRIFQDASIVIAPTGAALTNIAWCRPGTSVVVLAAEHVAMPLEIWSQLGEVGGCRVTSVSGQRAFSNTGQYAMHDDYTIQPEHVMSALDNVH